jgi:iron complex transport system ATP-binding protein
MDVRLNDVSVEVGGWRACDQVTLHLPAGTTTAVVGPNGAGKSSLLRCLYRALRPVTGTVLVGGDDVWQLPGPEAGRRTAAVAQEQPAGFDLPVRDVVALGRVPHRSMWQRLGAGDHQVIDDAIARVDLTALAHRDVATLSGGERQRALIARAIAQQATVLVLDEPTNHLDARHQLEALALVRRLGITVIAALHDLDHAANHADTVVVLDTGRVVAHGPPSDTLTPELIADVFGVHAEILTTATGQRSYALSLPDPGSRTHDAPPVSVERQA